MKMQKISAVYKIVNEVTNDFYIGSSKNVKQRWIAHKASSTWKEHPNSPMYHDMQKYGVDKFRFQILAPVMPEYLKQVEQEFIEMLHPTYNKMNAKGLNVERAKEYEQSEKRKECMRRYRQTDKGKETKRKLSRKYWSQPCLYNSEEITLGVLHCRFQRAGVEHPYLEAKKYLIR